MLYVSILSKHFNHFAHKQSICYIQRLFLAAKCSTKNHFGSLSVCMPVCLSVCMSVCMSVSIRVFYHLLKISSGNPHLKVCDIYRRANISKSCHMQFMDSLSLFLPTTHRADRLENPRNYPTIKKTRCCTRWVWIRVQVFCRDPNLQKETPMNFISDI